jgi:flagellar biosynthesis/type III secretory pathway chaperone
MTETAAVLDSVLGTVLAEEETLSALIILALREQDALVASDYAEIARVGEAMLDTASNLEVLERRREALLESIDCDGLTLDKLVPVADDHGVEGFAAARLSLVARANELRDAQERNARLLLSAMKLQEKWMNMFASLASTTYGADGLQEQQRGRRFVSRSA